MTPFTDQAASPFTVASYSTDKELFAARYVQGGRTVLNVAMTLAQITTVVKRPNSDAAGPGNRRIRPDHAVAFARYFIEHESWVVPGIILRAPGIFTFVQDFEVPDAQFGIVKYAERNQGSIRILDGQHRILGFHLALEMVDELLDRAHAAVATTRRVEDPKTPRGATREAQTEIARLEKVKDRFYKERVSVEIHVTDDDRAYKQMFFDIADNALGITASVRARFDSRKAVNRALADVLADPLLAGRVDLEGDILRRRTPNLLTARHVAETMRVLTVGFDGRVSRKMDKELDERVIARTTSDFFTLLTEAFLQLKAVELGQILPDTLRETSMLGAPLMLRMLAGVYYDLTRNHAFTRNMVLDYFQRLAEHFHAPAHANSIWRLHLPGDSFNEDSWNPNGRRQDAKATVEAMVGWAIVREGFVDAEPLPSPESAPVADEGIHSAPAHDTKALEAEERVAIAEIAGEGKAHAHAVEK